MKLFKNVRNNLKSRKFIIGVIVFLVTLVVCLIIFRSWDTLKAMIF